MYSLNLCFPYLFMLYHASKYIKISSACNLSKCFFIIYGFHIQYPPPLCSRNMSLKLSVNSSSKSSGPYSVIVLNQPLLNASLYNKYFHM